MDTETLKLILTIWGAGLSSLLGVLAIIKFKRESKIRVSLISKTDSPFDHIRLSVCNLRSKPATLIAFSIGIGVDKDEQTEILRINLDEEKKLGESDIWTDIVEREQVLSAYLKKDIKQTFFQVLWANILLSTGQFICTPIYINPKIIEENYYIKAERFVATDKFLKRKHLDSIIFKVGHKD